MQGRCLPTRQRRVAAAAAPASSAAAAAAAAAASETSSASAAAANAALSNPTPRRTTSSYYYTVGEPRVRAASSSGQKGWRLSINYNASPDKTIATRKTKKNKRGWLGRIPTRRSFDCRINQRYSPPKRMHWRVRRNFMTSWRTRSTGIDHGRPMPSNRRRLCHGNWQWPDEPPVSWRCVPNNGSETRNKRGGGRSINDVRSGSFGVTNP